MQAHPQSRSAARSTHPSRAFPRSPSDVATPAPSSVSTGRNPHSPEALAHDARNLLTGLGLYAELLAAPGVLSEGHRHYAAELRLLAERSTALLRLVLESAQLPAAASPPAAGGLRTWPRQESEASPEPPTVPGCSAVSATWEPVCDAAAVLRRFLPLLQGLAGGAAEVIVRLAPGLPPLPLPAQTLERVTANLVGNAAAALRGVWERGKSPAEPGSIWVNLEMRDGEARLTVEDSGPGMPPTVAAALVHPRAAMGAVSGSRRGLGHPIVHGLVTETGGRLAVRPRPGGGTVVSVRWPLASPAALRTHPADLAASGAGAVLAC